MKTVKTAKSAKKSVNEFTAFLKQMNLLSKAQSANFVATDADIDAFSKLQLHDEKVAFAESLIDKAQVKRNVSAHIDTTSLFCRLSESTKQNYRIDKALEQFHTMRELMQLTDCSESRIKSHVKYIMLNCYDHCKRVVDANDSKKFKFVLTN